MVWKKTENRMWKAEGKNGVFIIEQSGKTFWSRYSSSNGVKAFKLRPKQKLSEAKFQCEENYYWEEA